MILSYQLYSSRNFGPLDKTCRMLAEKGFEAVEPFGDLLEDVDALASAVESAGLRLPSSHIGLFELEKGSARFISLANRFGMKRLYVPFIGPDFRPDSAAGWRELGELLENLGKPLRDAGLEFGWHNHDFEFEPFDDGTLPIDALFEGGPSLQWECDVAWVVRSGADPVHWIEKYADRINAVHVKDIAPAGEKQDEDGWADPGTGTVEWSRLYPMLREQGQTLFIVEHDNPSDDNRFAETAARCLKSLEAAR